MHNPEFTLLEWYRLGADYLELADEVVDLIRFCARGRFDVRFDEWPVHRITYRDAFLQSTGLDPMTCGEDDLADCASERGIRTGPLNHGEWLDLMMAEIVQKHFDAESFTILHDFPPEQAALSVVTGGPDPVAQRFEVFAGAMELANGYQELRDAAEQLRRFERENARQSGHSHSLGHSLGHSEFQAAAPIDHNLIAALSHGLPECAGVALGIDRLLMVLLGVDHIALVLAFDSGRS
jgi:lysyl-tRNA synthetase class 2